MTTINLSPFRCCALCGATGPLEDSHVIPKFAFRWLKETSGTGYLRSSQAVNRRVQDGYVLPMLCPLCEDRFSPWEGEFASRLFRPFASDTLRSLTYGETIHKCAVSICWRALTLVARHGSEATFKGRWQPEMAACLDTWRSYLLGTRPDVGAHDIHLVPWNGIVGGTGSPDDVPANIDRYLQRSIEMHSACNDEHAFVYVKLGPMQLVGMVAYPAYQWNGTLLSPTTGLTVPSEFLLPALYGEYVFGRAHRFMGVEASLSDPQYQKIVAATTEERLAKSGTFRATNLDHGIFGDRTFPKRPGQSPKP